MIKAGPQITLFLSTSFCFNDKKKKIVFGQATLCVEFSGSPHVCVGFLQVLWFLLHPTDVHVK